MSKYSILEQLARQLTPTPSLKHLINLMEESEEINYFLSLIREYVPKDEADIMCEPTTWEQVVKFGECFEKLYFPISTDSFDEDDCLHNLLSAIPIILEGLDYDNYHEFEASNAQPAFIAVLALTAYPYNTGDGIGERLPFMEELAMTVGKALVQRIPKEGYSLDCLRYCLRGNKHYAGFLYGAEYVSGDTGCFVLDNNWNEGYSGDSWDPKTVTHLTEQYQEVKKRTDADVRYIAWFNQNPVSHLTELIDYLEERSKKWRIKEAKRLKSGAKKKLLDGRSQTKLMSTPTR